MCVRYGEFEPDDLTNFINVMVQVPDLCRPEATSVRGHKLLVYEALSY